MSVYSGQRLTTNAAQCTYDTVEGRKTTGRTESQLAICTLVSDDSVTMRADNDLNIHDSQIVADADIAIRAGRDTARS